MKIKVLLKLLRVQDWTKNIFILIPLFFSGELFNLVQLKLILIAIIGFSFVASSVYIINDIFDIEKDKIHPLKRYRPLQSGLISIKLSMFLSVFLLILGLSIFYFTSFDSFLITLLYFLLNLLYSYKLKHIPIVDFMVIAFGFVLRILIGGMVINITLSPWLIIMVLLLSVFIAVSKRRDDVYQYEHKNEINRKVVVFYSMEFMDKVITIISSVLIVSYLLFITSEEIQLRYGSNYLLFTFIFVIIGVLRYNQITYVYNKSASPIKLLFSDLFLQICVILWSLSFFFIIYKNHIFQ